MLMKKYADEEIMRINQAENENKQKKQRCQGSFCVGSCALGQLPSATLV